MHRLDYWSGYYANMGQHKSLVKQAFHKWNIAKNFMTLTSSLKCKKEYDPYKPEGKEIK